MDEPSHYLLNFSLMQFLSQSQAKRKIEQAIEECARRPIRVIILLLLLILPFLDGGTNFISEILLLLLPLPLFLIGISRSELNFSRLDWSVMVAWLGFILALGFSLTGSVSLIYSIPAFFQWLAYFLFFTLFCSSKREGDLKFNAGVVILAGVLLSLASFWYLLPSVAKPRTGMNLVYASYGHNSLADYLLLVIPVVFAGWLAARRQKQKIIFGILLGFFLVSFLTTFARGAFLVCSLICLFLILKIKNAPVFRRLAGLGLAGLPAAVILLVFIFSFSPLGLMVKEVAPRHWLVKQFVKPDFDANRPEYWTQALMGIRERPWRGFGVGTFELVAVKYQKEPVGWSSYAHNFFLQLWSESGIIGFASFAVLGFILFKKIADRRPSNAGRDFWLFMGLLAALMASIFHSFLDFDWHFPAIFLTVLFLIANLLPAASRYSPAGGRLLAVFLIPSLLCFAFGISELVGEYFYSRRDYERAIAFSFWPPVRIRAVGTEFFRQNYLAAKRLFDRLQPLFAEDPAMEYWRGEMEYNHGNWDEASRRYRRAVTLNPVGNRHLKRKLAEIYRLGKISPEEVVRLSDFLLSDRLPEEKSLTDNLLAKELYLIGWKYLKKDKDLTGKFWQKAVESGPEFSYFHLELASLYLEAGDLDEAKKAIENCLKFYWPKVHCLNYRIKLEKTGRLEAPGFFYEKVLLITK